MLYEVFPYLPKQNRPNPDIWDLFSGPDDSLISGLHCKSELTTNETLITQVTNVLFYKAGKNRLLLKTAWNYSLIKTQNKTLKIVLKISYLLHS